MTDGAIDPENLALEKLSKHQGNTWGILSVEERMALAQDKMGSLTDAQKVTLDPKVLLHILRLIAKDVEVRVRHALAETLSDKQNAPHEIVLALARGSGGHFPTPPRTIHRPRRR